MFKTALNISHCSQKQETAFFFPWGIGGRAHRFLSCLHIESVLFRSSAFRGAKSVSGVPAVIGCFRP